MFVASMMNITITNADSIASRIILTPKQHRLRRSRPKPNNSAPAITRNRRCTFPNTVIAPAYRSLPLSSFPISRSLFLPTSHPPPREELGSYCRTSACPVKRDLDVPGLLFIPGSVGVGNASMPMVVSSGLSCLGAKGVQDRWYGCALRPKSRRCVGAVSMRKGGVVAGGCLVGCRICQDGK